MKTNPSLFIPAFAFLFWAPLVPLASAAILSNGTVDTLPGPANLTLSGQIDWALWDAQSNTGVVTKAPTNRKSVGPGIISDISVGAAGTTNTVRGASTLGTETFTYSDGTSPMNPPSPVVIGLVLDSDLETVGQGVQFTITGNPAVTETVSIWATGFDAIGTLTVSLNNAAPITLFSQQYNATKSPTLFTFNFRPDLVTDVVTVKYIMSADGGTQGSSHVGIQAVAVSAVPEPSALAALLGGSTLLLGFRRRWQVA